MPVMARKNLSCIILAGGEGRRAGGADKGLLCLHGKPLVEHVIDSVRHQVDDIVISANRNIDSYQAYDYKVVRDSSDSCMGPLAGIHACLEHCNHEQVLVVPCDMPHLPHDLVQQMQIDNAYSVTVVQCMGRYQLVLSINRNCSSSISSALRSDERSLMKWVKQQQHKVSVIDKAELFTNLNHGLVEL